ncbi:MAG: class II fructose-bisphosphate aldolase [Gaiellaceae bacterium]
MTSPDAPRRAGTRPLRELLAVAQRGGFAVGSFSPRYTPMIRAILGAGEATRSPLIVQIAAIELEWYELSLPDFAREFWKQLDEVRPTVPVALHLDHTSDPGLIEQAIASGFGSVMIDASALPLEQNIAVTRRVVELAHPQGVCVEAELGRIATTDFVETAVDEELFTAPEEAATFVAQTGIDALAISIGTAHGVYRVKRPRIDLERLRAIRSLTAVPLVLHGGSDTPREMIRAAIGLPGGGVSKVNIATDLELALLRELGLTQRSSDPALRQLPAADLERGAGAVQRAVEEKIVHFLGSADHASDYQAI